MEKSTLCVSVKMPKYWQVVSSCRLPSNASWYGLLMYRAAGFDAKLMLWDMRASSRDPIQTLKEATSTITSLILPTSPQIITGSSDGYIRTYDLRFGLLTDDLVGRPITSLELSPTAPEESVLVGTNDGKVRVFDRKDGGCLQMFQGHKVGEQTGRWGMDWGYGDGLALAGDEEGKLWAWNVLDVSTYYVSICFSY